MFLEFLSFTPATLRRHSRIPLTLYLTSDSSRDALTALLAGIKEGRGFFALIAEPGMGKTRCSISCWTSFTIRRVRSSCSRRSATRAEFFQYLLSELGVDAKRHGLGVDAQ